MSLSVERVKSLGQIVLGRKNIDQSALLQAAEVTDDPQAEIDLLFVQACEEKIRQQLDPEARITAPKTPIVRLFNRLRDKDIGDFKLRYLTVDNTGWVIIDGCMPIQREKLLHPLYSNDQNFMWELLPRLIKRGELPQNHIVVPMLKESRFGWSQSDVNKVIIPVTEKFLQLPYEATCILPTVSQWRQNQALYEQTPPDLYYSEWSIDRIDNPLGLGTLPVYIGPKNGEITSGTSDKGSKKFRIGFKVFIEVQ